MSEGILISIIGLGAGAIGYILRRYLDQKQKKINELRDIKIEKYRMFVSIIINIFATSKTENSNAKKKKNTDKSIKELYEFYKDYILYASPQMIQQYSLCMQCLYQLDGLDKEASHKHMLQLLLEFSKVWLLMREEIGLSNKGLGIEGRLLRKGILKDYDTFFISK